MFARQRGGHGTLHLAWGRGRVGVGTGWYAMPRGSDWILELHGAAGGCRDLS